MMRWGTGIRPCGRGALAMLFVGCLVLATGCAKKLPPTVVRIVEPVEVKVPVPMVRVPRRSC